MFTKDETKPLVDFSRRGLLKRMSAVAVAGGAVATAAKTQADQFAAKSLKEIQRELERIKQLGQKQHEKLDQRVQRLDKRTKLLLRILLIYLGIQTVGHLLALFSAGAPGAIASAATTGMKVASKAIV